MFNPTPRSGATVAGAGGGACSWGGLPFPVSLRQGGQGSRGQDGRGGGGEGSRSNWTPELATSYSLEHAGSTLVDEPCYVFTLIHEEAMQQGGGNTHT